LTALVLAVLAAPAAARGLAAQQPATAGAAPMRLSLDDALRLAQSRSPAVDVARAGVTRANGQRDQARAQYLPQLSASLGYTKTLASQFSGISLGTPADTVKPTTGSVCAPIIPANATAEERAAALAAASTCVSSSGGGFNLSQTSFGATNQWAGGLSFSQNLFTGGRVQAQNRAAAATLRSAHIEVSAQTAQAALDVTSAYYDAALADQLVTIADSSLAETDAVLAQTKVARQVGNASEYDLLRAQVTRDNQVPVLLQARANRQVAYLNLKRLLNMPLDDSLALTTAIETADGPALPAMLAGATPDTTTGDRAPVRELAASVDASEEQVRIARAERIPSFALTSSYQRLYFPSNLFPALNTGVNNWTVGIATNFPILDGGRIKGDELVAQATVDQTRAQLAQTRQFAAVDTRTALTAQQEAQSTWDASRGTVEQAQREYAIDEVRFHEGISTQTDLAQSRLLLEQALANRAQAARNLGVARVRLALLHDLPLQSNTGTGASTQGAAGAVQQQQQQQQQTQQSQQQGATGVANPTTTTPPTSGTGGGGNPGSIQP
jgi:outer membrane protein TolC